MNSGATQAALVFEINLNHVADISRSPAAAKARKSQCAQPELRPREW